MAEVATSVLHNVGNVLNSVNVSSALISEKVQHSKITSFSKAVAMIEEHRADLPRFLAEDEKGRMLPGYLSKLAVNLEHEQKELLQEVESLAKNVLHIKEVVATQQNYARVSGPAEEVAMADLLEDALRINSGALDRHGITVKREYLESPLRPGREAQGAADPRQPDQQRQVRLRVGGTRPETNHPARPPDAGPDPGGRDRHGHGHSPGKPEPHL